jgi:hypothetical protein
MKKKTDWKLKLHRETLRNLEDRDLGDAAGGGATTFPACKTTNATICPTNHTNACSVCRVC